MRQTREQRLIELLQTATTNTTATSMVAASLVNNVRTGWARLWFELFGVLASGAQHNESGFAMIDEGRIYFYKVTGLGKRQVIEGRREITFDRIERVRRAKGGKRWPATLKIRWRNNNDKRLDLSLGGMNPRQFPNNQEHINEMTQLILANNVEIKPDNSIRNILLALFGVLAFFIVLIVILALVVEG